MTRIDFYIAQRYQFVPLACLVIEKAYKLENTCYIHTESQQQAAMIDEQLWTFKQNSFLPHELYDAESDQDAAILIGYNQQPGREFDVLINLTEEVPVFFNRFTRVAEIVGTEEAPKKIARARYKYYRENGYELYNHSM